jgi:hypothetical protein
LVAASIQVGFDRANRHQQADVETDPKSDPPLAHSRNLVGSPVLRGRPVRRGLYDTEGHEEGDPIGPKAVAEKIVQDNADQKILAFDTALKRADG